MNSDWLLNKDENILKAVYEDVMVTSASGEILQVSKGSGDHYGMAPEDMIGLSVYDLEKNKVFDPAITPEVLRKKKKVTVIQTTAAGKKIIVTGVPLFNEDGEIEKVMSYTYDVSELELVKEFLSEMEREMERVKSEVKLLRNKQYKMKGFVAESPKMKATIEMMMNVADVDVTVLLLGESGVGKSMIARWIHQNSQRKDGAFIEVNCSAIPEAIFEAEFFGYEGGAFTGAKSKGKIGYAEMANNGTLFLDEIGELPMHLQAKLLKFIQEKSFYRVGGSKKAESDFRLLAATNKDLKQAVAERTFREDLYFRLNVVPLSIPPLRERPEDLSQLISYFLEKFNEQHSRGKQLANDALDALLCHEWKGNVRELENLIERLVVTTTAPVIGFEELPYEYKQGQLKRNFGDIERQTLPEALEELEGYMLTEARKKCRTTTEMAALLGISQPSIVRKLKKYHQKH
ncbi:transcriptional regulator with PAS, ATPase and Fis domain [Bacillus ectoiniformans]|uniref:sigma-54 interaction domain-containing protein n=1 Tax=Bacillus ectoiniformans TaxID=1494429 RepID=UPI00195804BD|nr:sigma 54-interacting transcriptional regulator [Bacillus ectoiniformans]MBM7649525.1 transcriptional regulator with PAS, ATPase and Fis domain [Bacillus ectoiniformans]